MQLQGLDKKYRSQARKKIPYLIHDGYKLMTMLGKCLSVLVWVAVCKCSQQFQFLVRQNS